LSGLDESDDPRRMQEWNRDEVRSWLVSRTEVSKESADILWENEIDGKNLIRMSDSNVTNLGVKAAVSSDIKTEFMTLYNNWAAVEEGK